MRQRVAFEALLELRISMRWPAVYLTGRTWFAGLPMRTDARALIPRSPIAELIEQQFRPWIDPARVKRVLDLCTGGGCIALAAAHYLPKAKVDGTDISDEALELARENARDLRLSRRVRFVIIVVLVMPANLRIPANITALAAFTQTTRQRRRAASKVKAWTLVLTA